jgi:hypothetical protein
MAIRPPSGARRAVPRSPSGPAPWCTGPFPPLFPASELAADLEVSDEDADRPHDVEEREDTVAGELAGALARQAAGALDSTAARGAGPPDPIPVLLPTILDVTDATVTVVTRQVSLATVIIHPRANPAAPLVVDPRNNATMIRSPRPPVSGVSHPRRRRRLMKGLRHGAVVR